MSGLINRITSHLPGHQAQDNNHNGVPDRQEANPSNRSGNLATDVNRDGIPDRLQGGQGLMNQPLQQQMGSTMPMGQSQQSIRPLVGQSQQSQQQGFGFIGSTATNTQSVVDVREAPAVIERVERPAVIHEVLKTEEVVQIQPVIERQRETLDVYEVVQPIREREVVATEVRQAVLPAQTRATVVEDNSQFLAQRSAPADFSTREVAQTMSQTVQNAPIVHETIVHRVIEEVQPVIYKEIDRPILVKETLPIYEKIVEAPHSHHSVLPVRDLGVHNSTAQISTMQQPLQQGVGYQTVGLNSGIQSQGTFATQTSQGQGLLGQQLGTQGLQGQFANQNLGTSQGFSQGGQMGGQRSLHDLNGNGIPDRMEKGHGLRDLNGNGIDDSVERRMGNTSLNSRTY